jgi:hypothetical protein
MVLCCVKCGAKAKPGCQCDAAYVPARVYAAKAIAAHPEKSDRAIAAAIGVDSKTVAKARKATAEKSAVEKRMGRDGKARKLPSKRMTSEVAAAMKARAEAVARLFPPPIKTIPNESRAALIAALDAYASPLVETVRKRLNLTWDDLIIPAIKNENDSTLRESAPERPIRVASAA